MSSLRLALKMSMAESQVPTTVAPVRKMSFSEDDEKKNRAKRKREDENSSAKHSDAGDSDAELKDAKKSDKKSSLKKTHTESGVSEISETISSQITVGRKNHSNSIGSMASDISETQKSGPRDTEITLENSIKTITGSKKMGSNGKGDNSKAKKLKPIQENTEMEAESIEDVSAAAAAAVVVPPAAITTSTATDNGKDIITSTATMLPKENLDQVVDAVAAETEPLETTTKVKSSKKVRKGSIPDARDNQKLLQLSEEKANTRKESISEDEIIPDKEIQVESADAVVGLVHMESDNVSLLNPDLIANIVTEDASVDIQRATSWDSIDDPGTPAVVEDDDNVGGDDEDEEDEDTKAQRRLERKLAAQAKRKRRKSTELMATLAAAGIQNPHLEFGGHEFESEDVSPRYQSSRAAAQVAKTKLTVKSRIIGQDDDNKMDLDARSKAKSGRIPGDKRVKDVAAKAAPEAEWVACDSCSKWRKLPPRISCNSLPDIWYCSMNEWDEAHNSCEQEEESFEATPAVTTADVDAEDSLDTSWRRETPARPAGKGGKRGMSTGKQSNTIEKSAKRFVSRDSSDSLVKEGAQYDSETNADEQLPSARGSRRVPSNRGAPRSGAALENVDWVQCNRCTKWRRVPAFIKVSDLPDIWECKQNTWATAFARCSAKEETDADIVGTTVGIPSNNTNGNPAVTNNASPRGRRNPALDGVNAPAANPAVPTKTVTQWVQCERRNCKKWRKVPANVDMSQFPEKWYCEMNRWDLDRASCDGPEETDSESEQKGHSGPRSQLILANSKGPGQLSYRRIIYGVDGRMRATFSEKNKSGYGIFSFTETVKQGVNDDYVEPTRKLSYWWSSCYQLESALKGASSEPETAKRSSASDSAPLSVNNMDKYLLSRKHVESAQLDDAERSNCQLGLQTTYLLDGVNRINKSNDASAVPKEEPATNWAELNRFHQLPLSLRRHACKYDNIMNKLPLMERVRLSCLVVRSCLQAIPSDGMSLSALLGHVASCTFHTVEEEACRLTMNYTQLMHIIHRLEENGEVEISLNKVGDVVVQLVQLPSLAQELQGVSHANILAGTQWTKKGGPLKCRKAKY